MKNIRFNKKLFVAALSAVLLPLKTLLATTITVTNPLNDVSTVGDIIDVLTDDISNLITPLAILAILYAAFLFTTAGGDPRKIETAKKILLYALIAEFIALTASDIYDFVYGVINN